MLTKKDLTKKDFTKKSIDENIKQIIECIEFFKEKEEELIGHKTGDPIADAFLKYRIRRKIGLFGDAHALFFGVIEKELEGYEREMMCIDALGIMWDAMEYEDTEDTLREFPIFKEGYKACSKNYK